MAPSAVGFRVKSGRAIAVLLGGAATAPRVLDRRTVALADPAVPGAVQPYHAVLGLHVAAAPEAVGPLVAAVEAFAHRSVGELLAAYRDRGCRLLGAGIVVGSEVDPRSIANQHIRAHAEEGRLFRRVLEEALAKRGLAAAVTVEKRLATAAGKALRRPEADLEAAVTALGRGLDGPWRVDEKAAALAAWMVLAHPPG